MLIRLTNAKLKHFKDKTSGYAYLHKQQKDLKSSKISFEGEARMFKNTNTSLGAKRHWGPTSLECISIASILTHDTSLHITYGWN
jgi:hypothetical protein